jgi:hypothetical protein
MKKFIYDPSQYNNFHIEVRKKILNCFCVCGITPELVQNSRNIKKDCFDKFKCINLVKNKLEKTFYIKVNKTTLKNCSDIYDVYMYVIPIIKSEEEIRKAAKEKAALFLQKANEIRWNYVEDSYYEFD